LGYHKVLIDLLAFSRKESLQLEAEAIANASMVVFASRWAAEAAAKAVPAQARKISVIPFGANLERLPAPPLPIDFPGEVLSLLFIGVHWNDKGGPIAVQALQELKRRGHRARLIVCGCDVPREIDDHDIVREGYLDKRVTEQRARLEAHFRDAHFLVLPTRFEAYGIAFCEAAAYGVPALGTRTGGVPTIVEDGITGFLFDPEEDGSVYADRIEMLMNDPARWQRMRVAARERFEKHFTWDAFVSALFDQATAAGLIKSSR
jgi:glycosyltransferase involved in cell wall biosynthesis